MSFVSPAVTMFADDLGIEARGGLRTSAVCAPTRLQVMTGKYNFRNWRAFGVMDPAERTFAHELRDAGYRTGIVGKW
jgi:arylsulfatase A-like enzyme